MYFVQGENWNNWYEGQSCLIYYHTLWRIKLVDDFHSTKEKVMAINCIIKPFIWDLNNGPAILLKGVPPDFAMIWFDRHEVLVVLIIIIRCCGSVCRSVGAEGDEGAIAPPSFQNWINPISTRWADYSQHINTAPPPDYQTFLRPWPGSVAWRQSVYPKGHSEWKKLAHSNFLKISSIDFFPFLFLNSDFFQPKLFRKGSFADVFIFLTAKWHD